MQYLHPGHKFGKNPHPAIFFRHLIFAFHCSSLLALISTINHRGSFIASDNSLDPSCSFAVNDAKNETIWFLEQFQMSWKKVKHCGPCRPGCFTVYGLWLSDRKSRQPRTNAPPKRPESQLPDNWIQIKTLKAALANRDKQTEKLCQTLLLQKRQSTG